MTKTPNSGSLPGSVLDDALILLIEDREDDIIIIRKAFERIGLKNSISIARNGEEAIQYLDGKGPYADRYKHPLPHLILLDLKMPRVDGFGVLSWVRSQKHLGGIVVVVLTISDQIRDVNEAYRLGANSFLIKPDDFQNVAQMSNLFKDYWLRGNRASGNIPKPPPPLEPLS